jgi:hypothetical protein
LGAGCAFLALNESYSLWAKIGLGSASVLLFAAPFLLLMLHWRNVADYEKMSQAMGER